MIRIGLYLKFDILTYIILSVISLYSILIFATPYISSHKLDALLVMISFILLIIIGMMAILSYCKIVILKIHKIIPYLLKRHDVLKFDDDDMVIYYVSSMTDTEARRLLYKIALDVDIEYIKDDTATSKNPRPSYMVESHKYGMYMGWSKVRFNIEAFKILRFIKKKKLEIDFKEL